MEIKVVNNQVKKHGWKATTCSCSDINSYTAKHTYMPPAQTLSSPLPKKK